MLCDEALVRRGVAVPLAGVARALDLHVPHQAGSEPRELADPQAALDAERARTYLGCGWPRRLLMLAAGGPVFAFAKPVPVYLNNLKHPKRDEVLVALAGPASNLLLACLAALLVHLLLGYSYSSPVGLIGSSYIVNFLFTFLTVNLSLAFFNLIPLPPLDGSSILVPFLRGRALQTYYEIQRYAMPILIIVLYLLPTVLHIDLVDIYFRFTYYPVANALLSFAIGA